MQRWAGLANTGGGNVVVGGLRRAGREERQVEAAGLRLRHPASAPRREDGETRGWRECIGREERWWRPRLLPQTRPPPTPQGDDRGPAGEKESDQLLCDEQS